MKKKFKILIAIGVLLIIEIIVSFTSAPIDSHSTQKIISAPKEVVWKVVSDVANYHQYATGLTSVTIISGQGEGMVRSCSDEQGSWRETCTAWNEGSSYSFDVDTGSGFPYPFQRFNGTWMVSAIDENFSELTIEFEYQFPYRWMSWFFGADTRKAIDEGNRTLIDNWEKEIMKKD